jgi:DNA-binding SARP family transcriptional activator
VEFLVLGPIEVYSAGSPIRVGGVKQRSILALLIADQGRVVSTDRIVTVLRTWAILTTGRGFARWHTPHEPALN